jgi:hypothetical protein
MDVAMIVERVRIMAERPNADAIRALLETPDVEQLAILWNVARACSDDELVARAQGIPTRGAAAISLRETELDPEIARLLEKLDVTTVAEADAADDEKLLTVRGMSLFRVEELRAVVRKYLGGAVAAPAYGPVWERVRERIERALAAGLTTKQIVGRYKVHHLDVQRVLREIKPRREVRAV